MPINREQLEAAITDLCNRYEIPQMIVILRDGRDVVVKLFAGRDTDVAGGEVLYNAINKLLADPKTQERVNAAALAARKNRPVS